ncbi:hypothetical protein ACFFGF_01855 [Asaia lannensis]|uniref:Nucleoside phosphorylase domain-containing protein n=1 Tax=Asaia lannensis NBRC 102526 TaxID=1307926 RepID=A0ABT1CD32_9PROT|nr:hypothetical protein [Asaia lannensis]MCO6158764.1 hypothetical protein [Asaia lannensis NBRC 102526]
MKPLRIVLSCLLAGMGVAHAAPVPAYDATPRLGIVIPKLPADYGLLLNALTARGHVSDGAFDFQTGEIDGVPVVMIVQPAPGEVLRAIEATSMLHDFNVRVLLYPGTSGGHLPKGEMSIGDIVLGARNVNHGNYYLAPDGHMEGGEFKDAGPGQSYTGAFHADPGLLAMLACSAKRVATQTTLPAFLAPVRSDRQPQIFYYSIQGTSEIWSDNVAYTQATMKVFHEIDEDGDWYSNLAATVLHVPFLEVSVISNSIFAFPARKHGVPESPEGQPDSHVVAQRLSNRILLDLLKHKGQALLAAKFRPVSQPVYPESYFQTPHDPRNLLDGCEP